MPIIKSAQKRVRIARKATLRNTQTKRELKQALKNLQTALGGGSKSVHDALSKAQSALDTAVKKGVIHKNRAARKKAQLAAQVKASGAKVTKSTAKSATKPMAKSPAKKTAPAKKPAAKKSAVNRK